MVTDTLPEVPLDTTADMLVELLTTKDVAAVPPNFTALAVVKFVPVIVTVVPVIPDVGVKEVMVGAFTNVKPARVTVPPGVVTETLPEVPLAITAVILVALTTVKEVAVVPPKLTAVAPVKLVPVMVTVKPVPDDVGVNDVMVGAGTKVKPAKETAPPGVVTETLPLAPLATTAVIVVEFETLYDVAGIPPKLTAVAPVKLVPVMVTVAPEPVEVGVNEVMVGAGIKVKPDKVPVWLLELVTVTLPVVPAATTAVMVVVLTTLNDVAAVPPNLTELMLVKLVPVMVTVAPEAAEVGVKEEIVGVAPNTDDTNKNNATVANTRFLPMVDRILTD